MTTDTADLAPVAPCDVCGNFARLTQITDESTGKPRLLWTCEGCVNTFQDYRESQDALEPMTYDLALPLTERSQGELVDSAQSRIRGIYELDQQIVGKVDALDEVRRRMKAVTNGLIVMGVTGKNEKERDAGLAKLLADEKEYPDLMQQERQLHTELEQLRLTKDYLRRMHHLELALIQAEARP